ncbi:adenosylcobalamin-dependent ribonucleoside-diphosphate reductase [Patescibacteria group bacterium]
MVKVHEKKAYRIIGRDFFWHKYMADNKEPKTKDTSLRIRQQKIKEMQGKNKNIIMSENSKVILQKRYLKKDKNQNPDETIEEMFERVASVVAKPDAKYTDVKTTKQDFYNLLTTKRFFPNSPTFTGAGTGLGQLAGCFVLPVSDDMGKQSDGIFSTLRDAALIQQSGGGNGFSFSGLRPRGSLIGRSNGKASGPVGFMSVYDAAFGEIAQGGVRRGANMAVLDVDHPDIREFVKCKSDEGSISNFNISVALTDTFMEAVEKDETYDLVDPNNKEVVESPRAREIYDLIVENAHKNGEPGVLFIDTANRYNPVPHMYELKATNPCGEQWLGPYENCCLGSINLAQHLDDEGDLDWELLEESTELATRFLDNVVTANKYVPSVAKLRESALNARRIGLGFMGLSDVMYSMGIRYGSPEGQEFAAQVIEFIRYHSMITSIRLAEERGPFKKIKGSIYDPDDLKWTPPTPLYEYNHDFNRPNVDWTKVTSGLKLYGIRNAAQTTVAPTGTISTVAGVEGYGCEPVFALAYYRNVYQAAGDEKGLTLTYTSPAFMEALDKEGIVGEQREKIIDQVIKEGTCQNVEGLPESIKDVFVVSADIKADEHIKMQASIQAFIDNSISKTCNLPAGSTKEDVSDVYKMGWELGCKGLTVYITGSRQEVVLETKETKDLKEGTIEVSSEVKESVSSSKDKVVLTNGSEIVSPRGYVLSGSTYKINTPQGKAYITLNKSNEGEPLEVFINVGKAGSDVAALSEGLGRLVSGWLRYSNNREHTIKEIVVQLIGIGGSTSVGFGKNKVSSLPDAIAKILAEDHNITLRANGSNIVHPDKNEISFTAQTDMCPDCGNSTLVLEEGCSKCYSCGFSKC